MVVRIPLSAWADWFEIMTFTVYVIKDECDRRYTGYTSDIDQRLWEHNNGFTITTKKGKNWKIMYSRGFDNKHDAMIFERFLKTGKGREFLKTLRFGV